MVLPRPPSTTGAVYASHISNMTSRLPRPRTAALAAPTPTLLEQYSTLLQTLHYPAASLQRLSRDQAWVEQSEDARELIEWLREAFHGAVEEITIEPSERDL